MLHVMVTRLLITSRVDKEAANDVQAKWQAILLHLEYTPFQMPLHLKWKTEQRTGLHRLPAHLWSILPTPCPCWLILVFQTSCLLFCSKTSFIYSRQMLSEMRRKDREPSALTFWYYPMKVSSTDDEYRPETGDLSGHTPVLIRPCFCIWAFIGVRFYQLSTKVPIRVLRASTPKDPSLRKKFTLCYFLAMKPTDTEYERNNMPMFEDFTTKTYLNPCRNCMLSCSQDILNYWLFHFIPLRIIRCKALQKVRQTSRFPRITSEDQVKRMMRLNGILAFLHKRIKTFSFLNPFYVYFKLE